MSACHISARMLAVAFMASASMASATYAVQLDVGADRFGLIRNMLPSGFADGPLADAEPGQGGPPIERLQHIRQRMHVAQVALAASDLTGSASITQQQAVDELERLLTRMESQCRKIADKRTEPKAAQRQPADGQAGASSTPGEAEETAATTPTAPPVDREAISRLVKDRWGQLPQRQRDELLQPLSDQFMPQYAEDIQEYFRVLAESTDDAAEQGP